MSATQYMDQRFRQCPSFAQWNKATHDFIADNNKDSVLRFAMFALSEKIGCEYNARAYQPGPKGRLP